MKKKWYNGNSLYVDMWTGGYMFGYITINKLELKVKDYYTYHAYYCGLCKTLKERHKRAGQLTLTYDMTFLILVLTSLYEVEPQAEQHHCIVHPAKKHWMFWNEFSEYAADLNIALAYYHFKDDWEDEKKLTGKLGMTCFQRQYKKVKTVYKRQCKAIEEGLRKLEQLEQKKEDNLDVISDCFGEIMGELFVYKEDMWQENLRKFGFFLGKFIYLMDAYDDLDEDKKKKNFNPLLEISEREDYEEYMIDVLQMMMAECAKEYEKLPILKNKDILHNILYLGVWGKYNLKRTGEKNNDNRSI